VTLEAPVTIAPEKTCAPAPVRTTTLCGMPASSFENAILNASPAGALSALGSNVKSTAARATVTVAGGGVGFAVGLGVDFGVGFGVAPAVGPGVGFGVGPAVGAAVGVGVRAGVGGAVGVTAATGVDRMVGAGVGRSGVVAGVDVGTTTVGDGLPVDVAPGVA
jgi:hypothetical protein